MTSDDRTPEPPEGPAAPPVPEPPTADAAPAPDSASWGTTSSPVYRAGVHDTQPLTTTLADTQPLATGPQQPPAWTAPTPPALVPGGLTATPPPAPAPGPAAADPWAVRQDAWSGAAPGAPAPVYGTPPAGPPPAAPTFGGQPSGAAPYGTAAYGAAPYGTAPQAGPAPGGPPYGGPGYGGPGSGGPGSGGPGQGGPGYGGPGQGAPPYGGPGQPYGWAPPQPTDGLAVASLVTSVGGLVLLAGATGPIGIGLGIGALARIRRTGARGRGMAIAGIVVGAVATVVLALVVWVTVWFAQLESSYAQDATDAFDEQGLDEMLEDLESDSGTTDDLDGLLDELDEQLGDGLGDPEADVLPSYALPQDVALGTCWATLPEFYDLSDAVTVPCDEDHEVEVVALLTATGAPATDLTVDDPVLAEAYAQCDSAVEALDPGLLGWGYTDVWLPHPDQVAAGQLVGYCVYEDTFGTTGSLVAPASGVSS
ncbi:DUF4190 domain-containing protein [Cellulomonas sp. S1-8]|uniref:DUF4190 domain-containing protein n=1 Tax=Cellulomonas sp. S1-8 TaxID=2904790 RepID=UPI00224341CF|nr:DUF4190 domain-containing protein [Cellulomonas sp. S1-8]UZN03939.1 DUF4190 domain-containing protein [Cellulomonas sp. S1-8]